MIGFGGRKPLPKRPLGVVAAVFVLYALAAGLAALAVWLDPPGQPCLSIAPGLLLCLAVLSARLGLGVQRGGRWSRNFLVDTGATSLVLGVTVIFVSPSRHVCFAALPVALCILLSIPSSRRWYAEVDAVCHRPRSAGWLTHLTSVSCAVLFAGIGFSVLLAIPRADAYSRLTRHEELDTLVSCESNMIMRVFAFGRYGTNYTAAVLKPIDMLSSGPAVFIFDEAGHIVDRCSDSGDDPEFLHKWNIWSRDFLQEQ